MTSAGDFRPTTPPSFQPLGPGEAADLFFADEFWQACDMEAISEPLMA